MAIRNELIEELLAEKDPQEVFAQDGLLDELKKALAERILKAEMDQHLAAGRTEAETPGPRNHRNGHSRKTVLTGTGALELQVPRDRQASFEPQLIAKYRRRFPDFDDKVVSLYARGMTTREIQGHLRELYGIEVSPDLISVVTDAVLEQVAEWQNRPLDALYALVFFDALRVKIRDEGTVRNKAVYLALGVRPDGTKEILGLWIEQTEGAKFWLRVMNELRNRGVADMLIAIVDGLKGGAGEGSVERSSMECRRRVPGGYQRRLPGGPDPDLHCPPDPPLAGVRVLEGTPRRRRGAEADLPRRQCRDRPRAAGRVRCRSLGKALPRHRARLAASVGAGGAVLCLPHRGTKDHLHDKRHRKSAQPLAQSGSGARPLPQR